MADTKKLKKEWSSDFDFSSSLGETVTEFLNGLRDRKFIGNKCGAQWFFPPKSFCNRTLTGPTDWMASDGTGIVEAFTVHYKKPSGVVYPDAELPVEPPYILASIKIDLSDQCFFHFISGVDSENPMDLLEEVKKGLIVKPVWSDKRTGSVLDIKYFEPVE